MKAPVAKKIPHVFIEHQYKRIDNYYWLRNKENKEVLAYINSENEYLKHTLKHTEPFQEELYKEMRARIKEDDDSVPYFKNGYWYYHRYEKGNEHPIYCRKKDSLNNKEEIFLNENELASDFDYYEIVSFSVSPNNKVLAFCEDITGRRLYRIRFLNIETRTFYRDSIEHTSNDLAWKNNQTIFYTLKDRKTLRPFQVKSHILNTPADNDEIVYTEKDDTFITGVSKDKLNKYIYIGCWSTLSTEYRLLDIKKGTDFEIFRKREEKLEYYVETSHNGFYIKHNADGDNFSVSWCAFNQCHKKYWETVIEHKNDILIEDFELFENHLVVQEKQNGLTQLRVLNYAEQSVKVIPPKEDTYTLHIGTNPNYFTQILRIGYSSMTTPSSVIDIDLNTFKEYLKKQAEVLGNFKANDYQSERIWTTAYDGEKIPMSLVYKKDMFKKDGTNPILVYGYGSYGHTIDPYFSSVRLSLLDRGFVFVICHIRGSEYLGRQWYENGKFLKKKNTFTDFISCTQHLIYHNYCSKDKVFAMGGSAGGLLMGAIVNLHPNLYKGIVSNVPFVDVVTTMMDESIPLTTGEYDEWGNPNDETYYFYMLSYSPYDNIEPKAYPNMLITSGLHDSQVQFWEPTKYVAKLRALKTDDNLLLLHTNTDAGHGGSSGRFEHLKEIALEYAFILDLID
ncbi:MAG TPA: S9 family peptidase [Crocinitomix sp.]|nr:S9 family peptidase [Crocinitomix sp.]